jgi:hypothetical protein
MAAKNADDNKFQNWNFLFGLVGVAVAIVSAYFAYAANRHSAEAARHALAANNISAISSRADSCFRIAEHYYLHKREAPKIGVAHFKKARAFIQCASRDSGEEVAKCIDDIDQNFSSKNVDITC